MTQASPPTAQKPLQSAVVAPPSTSAICCAGPIRTRGTFEQELAIMKLFAETLCMLIVLYAGYLVLSL